MLRKLITAFLLEHTQHNERHLASLGDKDLLKLYDETRDTINSLADL